MARLTSDPARVRFYQLGETLLLRAVAIIVAKAYARGMRVAVATGERLAEVDELLWVQPAGEFLPHGRCDGPHAARQPILVCREADDANGATVLVAAHGRMVEEAGRFELVVDFVSADAEALEGSRRRYRTYREQGCRMEYWVQEEGGSWKQKE